ncbi:MAG: helix-turn-helix domain-containing protein [Lachnospiraceae bacterium]|nr:helix-turn-helix domain-containing protein [Lachnospiraceae bacterium]
MKYRPEYDMAVIGENLKRLREANNLTVDQVREYLRLGSVQAVYKYEKGKCYPQADTMFALMELYGAQLSDITCRHDAMTCRTNGEGHEPSSFFARIVVFG